MDGTRVKVVRSLSREDSSIAWFPLHNSLHLEMPPNVSMVHINIFSESGMTTFLANPAKLQSHHMPWDKSSASPIQAGPNTFHYYPNNGYAPNTNHAQIPTYQLNNFHGSNITLPSAPQNFPFQRSREPSGRSHSHNIKHMPVPKNFKGEPGAEQGTTPQQNPLLAATLNNTNSCPETTNISNQIKAVLKSAANLHKDSPADRSRTAPVRKDMQCADVTPHPTTGVNHTQGPDSIPEEDNCSSSGSSTMSVDASLDDCSVKVNTSIVTSSSSLPTQAVEPNNANCSPNKFKRSHSNQSEDCYIVEEQEQDKDSDSEHLVQESVISSPPRKLPKGDEENEQNGEVNNPPN